MDTSRQNSSGVNQLTDIEYIKNLFRQFGLKPKHYLGQNFLIDEAVLNEIVATAELSKDDSVIEVGPGIGVLTSELAAHAKEVYAVEKDRNLIPILKRQIKNHKNVKVINEDILRINPEEMISGPYKVVANIPYYLTSNLLQHFLTQKNKPKLLVLMVQKEVGERVVAQAGDLSILGISVQIFSDPVIAAVVPKDAFWPKPKVDSVILKLTPNNKYPEIKDQKLFFRIVKVAFSGKRKQIHNTLASGLSLNKEQVFDLLSKSGIEPTLRPQDLSIQKWISLYKVMGEME